MGQAGRGQVKGRADTLGRPMKGVCDTIQGLLTLITLIHLKGSQ